MTSLLVGCPTQNRTWILPKWKEYVEAATPRDWDLELIFAVPRWDTDTINMVTHWDQTHLVLLDEPEKTDQRNWANKDSYRHMAEIRNELLRRVRTLFPDIFLSLDCDILLNALALQQMYETMVDNQADVVSSLTYLDPVDPLITNVANWSNYHQKKWTRVAKPGRHKVDIVMAIQLMNNLAYNVNYEYDHFGEDFGFARNLRTTKCNVFVDGRSASKHVMSREWLDVVDKRVGY